jgi:1-deoxy-D-xylulose-5-phosphate reductoisomerase
LVSTAAAAHPGLAAAPRRLSILGATGSIGTSTLSVLEQRPGAFAIEAVTANSNAAKLAAIARKTNAGVAAIADPSAYGELRAALAGSGIVAMAGPDAVVEAAGRPSDLVVAAIVGAAGLAPTMAAIRAGATIALANKECLVSAGALFMAAARLHGADVLPVDSEHNAIFQLLAARDAEAVERITVTASGGPFRTWTREQMAKATPADALRHPTWSMGAKITIDSATLMNKGLELIEAHHLFGQPNERLAVLVHPQSIVHGLVAMRDGYVLAALSPPDMRTPIANCLAWPESAGTAVRSLDLAAIGRLEFEEVDAARFPALGLARQALEAGGWATNMLSAANEIAVSAFLDGRLGFLEIARIVEDTLGQAAGSLQRDPTTVEEALTLDGDARRIASDLVARNARPH